MGRDPIGQTSFSIVRHPESDLRIDGESVGLRHRLIGSTSAPVSVSDLDSSHGTFANRDRIAGAFDRIAAPVGPRRSAPAGAAELFADLRRLEAEFESVKVRWKERVLRVTTGELTLAGVGLNPFALDLHWAAPCEPAYRFEIVALEPNRPRGPGDHAPACARRPPLLRRRGDLRPRGLRRRANRRRLRARPRRTADPPPGVGLRPARGVGRSP